MEFKYLNWNFTKVAEYKKRLDGNINRYTEVSGTTTFISRTCATGYPKNQLNRK